jgi:hypothetical protein
MSDAAGLRRYGVIWGGVPSYCPRDTYQYASVAIRKAAASLRLFCAVRHIITARAGVDT